MNWSCIWITATTEVWVSALEAEKMIAPMGKANEEKKPEMRHFRRLGFRLDEIRVFRSWMAFAWILALLSIFGDFWMHWSSAEEESSKDTSQVNIRRSLAGYQARRRHTFTRDAVKNTSEDSPIRHQGHDGVMS